MTAITTPIGNRQGLYMGWKNPTAPAILLNTHNSLLEDYWYLKSYLLIKEYLRFQQINLIAFDIKAASPYKKIIYLSMYQHMLYSDKEQLYTDLKFLWFNKQALQQRYRYKSNIIYNFNIIKNVKNGVKIKAVLRRHRSKVRNTLLCRSKEWQHMQIRYLRPRTKTWFRRRREFKLRFDRNIIKNQLKSKLKTNKWKYNFIHKPIIFKNRRKNLKRLKLKKYSGVVYSVKKTYKLTKNFINHSIKKFLKLKKYKKKVLSTVTKKNRRFLTDIAPIINKKSKRLAIRYFSSFFNKTTQASWIVQHENNVAENKTLRNIFNVKSLKTHLKIFLEIFFKNYLKIDAIVKINQTSTDVYVKHAIKGLSTVNLELKRINKLDYFKRLAYVFINAHKNQSPQLIADIIAREVELTREFKRFCYNIDLVFSAFMSGFLHSYRIVISGKTNPRDLRRDWEVIKYQNKDSIPKKQFNKRVLYALGVARNNRGQFGIKVWLYY